MLTKTKTKEKPLIPTMTMEELWTKVNEPDVADFLMDIYNRGQDEMGLEDFGEYREVVQKHVGALILKATSDPMSFMFFGTDGKFKLTFATQNGKIVFEGSFFAKK